MRSALKVTSILILLAVVALIGWLVVQKVQSKGGQDARPRGVAAIPVETSPIQHGPIRDIRSWTGTLEPRAKFVVAPKIAGRLKTLSVDIGDPVTRNDTVAILDSAELAQQIVQAKAEQLVADATVEEVEKALAAAKREFDRVKMLHEQGVASDSDLDLALSPYESQQGKLKVAQAQVVLKSAAVTATEIREKYATVTASWEGEPKVWIVGEKFADEGDMLAANAPIISVLDIHTVVAVINVTDRDYTRLAQGQVATLTSDACTDKEFPGSIKRLAPMFRETSRQARVEVEAANPQSLLKPGMFVKVTIELGRSEDAVIVPLSAIARRDEKQGVFIVDEAAKKAKFVQVTVGITEGEKVQILSPAIKGRVVTLGQHLLEDGSPIRVADLAPVKKGDDKPAKQEGP
ncbi:MAG: efflux RND transporter periplasmic adaptor subunit [Phycisphaeraceae bacterium]